MTKSQKIKFYKRLCSLVAEFTAFDFRLTLQANPLRWPVEISLGYLVNPYLNVDDRCFQITIFGLKVEFFYFDSALTAHSYHHRVYEAVKARVEARGETLAELGLEELEPNDCHKFEV